MNTQTLPLLPESVVLQPVLHQPTTQEYLVENLFSLDIKQKQKTTKIVMQLHYNQVNTHDIPTIVELLEQNLPNVLFTQCFNDEGFPFNIEVKNTEIGHLFEHILLEYLCQLKIAKGATSASFSGKTKWNWIRDPRGKFHIHLTCGVKDADILPLAIEKAVQLMKIILANHQTPLFITKPEYGTRNGLKNGTRSSEI